MNLNKRTTAASRSKQSAPVAKTCSPRRGHGTSPSAPWGCECISHLRQWAITFGALSILLKGLLWRSAYSTDLEVHFQWKALLCTKPLSQWYVDTTLEWPVDYPVIFLYFERALCSAMRLIPSLSPMLNIFSQTTIPKASSFPHAVPVLRFTALLPDPLYVSGVYALIRAHCIHHCCTGKKSRVRMVHALATAIFLPGLFLVDSVHFQYNALPAAIFLHCIAAFMRNHISLGVFLCALTVNTRHTLLPVASVFGIHTFFSLVRRAGTGIHARNSSNYCYCTLKFVYAVVRQLWKPLCSFAAGLVLPWLPFFAAGGKQLLQAAVKRMFPFERGLLHAYWAPNVWAIYAALDTVLHDIRKRWYAITPDMRSHSALTGGIVGIQRPFRVLPNITPLFCTMLLAAALVPVLVAVAQAAMTEEQRKGAGEEDGDGDGEEGCVKNSFVLAKGVAYCSLSTFLYGWHVHEKACIWPMMVLAPVVVYDESLWLSVSFVMLIAAGQFGLFPLITGASEMAYKIFHYTAYIFYAFLLFLPDRCSSFTRYAVFLYVLGIVLVEMYSEVGGIHHWIFGGRKLQFVPLMLISVYAALGMCCAFVLLAMDILLPGRRPAR